jgi:ATP adenylyltransferase
MERLYTPWRREYVVNPKAIDCPFCQYIAQDTKNDAENLILLRSKRCFVILNRYPYNNGHLMILPNDHIADLEALDKETQGELLELVIFSKILLDRAFQPQGYNIGLNLGRAAGAGLGGHLHVHVVPRWYGDTNFMPVLAETRVLPEWLGDTYKRLRALLESGEFSFKKS